MPLAYTIILSVLMLAARPACSQEAKTPADKPAQQPAAAEVAGSSATTSSMPALMDKAEEIPSQKETAPMKEEAPAEALQAQAPAPAPVPAVKKKIKKVKKTAAAKTEENQPATPAVKPATENTAAAKIESAPSDKPAGQPADEKPMTAKAEDKPSANPAAKPAAAKTTAPKPVKYRTMPDNGPLRVDDEMPLDMTWGFPSSDNIAVPAGWAPDGKVTKTDLRDDMDAMAEEGDIIEIALFNKAIKTGDYVSVFRRGHYIDNAETGEKNLTLQRSGILRAVHIKGSKLTAEVIKIYSPIENGDCVKRSEGKRSAPGAKSAAK